VINKIFGLNASDHREELTTESPRAQRTNTEKMRAGRGANHRVTEDIENGIGGSAFEALFLTLSLADSLPS